MASGISRPSYWFDAAATSLIYQTLKRDFRRGMRKGKALGWVDNELHTGGVEPC